MNAIACRNSIVITHICFMNCGSIVEPVALLSYEP